MTQTDHNPESVRLEVRRLVGQMAPEGGGGPAAPGDRLQEDLGYGSVHVVELAVALEDEFALAPVSEEEAIDLVTVDHLERLVLSKLQLVA